MKSFRVNQVKYIFLKKTITENGAMWKNFFKLLHLEKKEFKYFVLQALIKWFSHAQQIKYLGVTEQDKLNNLANKTMPHISVCTCIIPSNI